MNFDTSILRSRRTILLQRLLPKLGSQAHFNTMCFSLAARMAAATNQSKERRQGKQVENKERHFEEAAKGRYARTHLCLTMKTTDLKRFMLRFI